MDQNIDGFKSIEEAVAACDAANQTDMCQSESNTDTQETSKLHTLGQTLLDRVPNLMAERAYRDRDKGEVKAAAAKLVRTLMAINNLDEYKTAIRIEGIPYQLSEYRLWSGFKAFVAPRKLQVTASVNSDDEKDLVYRSQYAVQSNLKVLTPTEFNFEQSTMIRKLVRAQYSFEQLERGYETINDDLAYAANPYYVRSTDQSRVLPIVKGFLYNESYKVSIDRWLYRWVENNIKMEG